MTSNVLAISAHPDDETLGCGGTLLKHAHNGDSVHWAIVTSASEPAWPADVVRAKLQEVEDVEAAYGMKECTRLALPAVELASVHRSQLIE